MLRVTDDGLQRPATRIRQRLTIALLLSLTLIVSALRGPVCRTWAAAPVRAPQPATVAPFDLSLLGPAASEAVGVFGIRPSAQLDQRFRQRMNAWIDLLLNNLDTDGVSIHVEDVEQLIGRVYFKVENETGQRSAMIFAHNLRTTKDVDWAKLVEQCGLKLKKHHYQGETYVSAKLPAFLSGIFGAPDDACFWFWAPDARTLILDDRSTIKALIAEKAVGTKRPTREFATGWNAVSRGLFAGAINNHGCRLMNRMITKEDIEEALPDPNKVESHIIRFCQNVSTLAVGVADGDDFRFDMHMSAETPDGAARLARACEGILAYAKSESAKSPDNAGHLTMVFLRKALERASVRREGLQVTIHADVPAGLSEIMKKVGWRDTGIRGRHLP